MAISAKAVRFDNSTERKINSFLLSVPVFLETYTMSLMKDLNLFITTS